MWKITKPVILEDAYIKYTEPSEQGVPVHFNTVQLKKIRGLNRFVTTEYNIPFDMLVLRDVTRLVNGQYVKGDIIYATNTRED
jgi:hypothetical protein